MCDVIAKERNEEKIEIILSLVADGDISIKKGAEKLNISVEQFIEKMTQRGFVIPAK